ncbi:unnamed protein product [Pleuronectes platessa]|uniref:Uncharacterized protein n=1 Tax=Pleuronectes platessa TaxID=8262 RepID=A0A9N7UGU1_PLEPL|nr:unnamed protein product [Pleuronectes platessa]
MKWWMDEWQRGGRVKGRAKPPLSEDRLMWVSERTPERNSPLFGSQLSDGPSGIAVCGRHPSRSSRVSFKHWLAAQREESVAVIFSLLKKLSSQALAALEAAEAPIDGITALDFTGPCSAPLCSAVLRCCC